MAIFLRPGDFKIRNSPISSRKKIYIIWISNGFDIHLRPYDILIIGGQINLIFKQLYPYLLRYSDTNKRFRGKKPLSKKVVTNYPDEIQKVIFNTTEVHLIKI